MRVHANQRTPLAPLQGAILAERDGDMVPGHRCAQPWAEISRPVGPMRDVPEGGMRSSTASLRANGSVPYASPMNRNSKSAFSLLIGPVTRVANDGRDSHAMPPRPAGRLTHVPDGDRDSICGCRVEACAVATLNRVPNGDRDSSPRLGEATPWDNVMMTPPMLAPAVAGSPGFSVLTPSTTARVTPLTASMSALSDWN